MEAEFVNIFVEKQRETIVDLVSRNIMLEARVSFASKTAEQVAHQTQEAVAQIQVSLEEAQAQVIATKGESERDIGLLKQTIAEKDKEINHLKTKVRDQITEADQLRANIKQLSLEQEVMIAKANRLKNKAKQLTEE